MAYNWGVCDATVKNWKRILKVPAMTEGSRRLVRLGAELARLPQSRAKLSAAKRGRPVSPKHILACYQAGPTRPWTPAEEAWLGMDSDEVIAKKLGRSVIAIQLRRARNGIRLRHPKKRP